MAAVVLLTAAALAQAGCSPTNGSTGITVVAVYENVNWYPACATSPIELGGRLFYPLPMGAPAVDESKYPLPPSHSGSALSGFGAAPGALGTVVPRVVAPGPGDDIGTVVAYSDGMARFESDSGNVAWLTLEKQYYGYVC